MTETTERLRWEPGEDGILFGYSGTLKTQAFVICPPGSPGEFWMISTSFPLGQPRYVSSEGEARKAAERWLEEFVTSLGAVFPAGPLTDDQRWQVGEARDLLARWDRERFSEDGYAAERTLADQVRILLAIVDRLAPANPAPAGEE